MKNFCIDLKEHVTKIINYEIKEIILLTKQEKKTNSEQKVCYICKKRFSTDDSNKKYFKVRDHFHFTEKYRGVARDICNLRYKTLKETRVAFHDGSTYDFRFIMKELAEEFQGKFECFGGKCRKIHYFLSANYKGI